MATGPPPLAGIKVLEFAGLAPGPYAGMLLADAGASVLRVDRPGTAATADVLRRRKASISVALGPRSDGRGAALVRRLVARARVDVLIDPFRPGVMERLGLGPDALLAANPRLVYARLTGFRRDGRYAMAGHDINYLAVSGALSLLGRAADSPLPPANMLADFAGGGAVLVHGILLALVARHASGRGQVVDANMVDGVAHLATFSRLLLPTPLGGRGRGRNLLDGGCPFYDTYATRDGAFMAVGALEPRFFRLLADGLGLAAAWPEDRRRDPRHWPALRHDMAAAFRRKTRAEWERVFDGSDACCLPVLDYAELRADPAREGDQRPVVALSETPCLAVAPPQQAPPLPPSVRGQGPGVPGDGYEAEPLAPGEGAEQVLESWLGWERGRDYLVEPGGFVLAHDAEPKL